MYDFEIKIKCLELVAENTIQAGMSVETTQGWITKADMLYAYTLKDDKTVTA